MDRAQSMDMAIHSKHLRHPKAPLQLLSDNGVFRDIVFAGKNNAAHR